MPKINEAQLKEHLKKGEFSRVYFIYGEDNYLKDAYVKRLSEKCVGNVLPEMNLQKFGGDVLLQTIADEVEQLPVMAENRMVIISDYDVAAKGKNEVADLTQVIKNIPRSTVLIFLLDSISFDNRSAAWIAFSKLCQSCGSVIDCAYKTDSEIAKYLTVWADKKGVRFDRNVCMYLIEMCGRDLKKLQVEVEKLCAFRCEEGYITKEDIDRLCAKTPDATKYMLPKAIFSGNVGKSLNILGDLIDMRMKSDEILYCLCDAFIDVFRVKTALKCGKKPTDIAEDFGYAKNRAFVLTNSAGVAKQLSSSALKRCLDILCEVEERFNTFVETNERMLLEKTIILLAEIVRGKEVNA